MLSSFLKQTPKTLIQPVKGHTTRLGLVTTVWRSRVLLLIKIEQTKPHCRSVPLITNLMQFSRYE